jgi:hypothetical protein
MKGFDLTRERFYRLLEATVTDTDEFRRSSVHKVLKSLRDCVGIRSVEFLKYHEKRDIQPCFELVSHLKATQRKKVRRQAFKQQVQVQAAAGVVSTSLGVIDESMTPGSAGGSVVDNSNRTDAASNSRAPTPPGDTDAARVSTRADSTTSLLTSVSSFEEGDSSDEGY